MQTVIAPVSESVSESVSELLSTELVVDKDKQVSKWIFNPLTDFWALHGGAGLLVLPIALLGWFAVDGAVYTMLITIYSLTLGFPHLAATHVRLNADSDVRQQFKWLSWQAPLAIMALVAIALYAFNALPYLVFAWFSLQTWHANRQNYGIMRRYIRMGDSDPSHLVNKTAGALIEFFPWAPVLSACLWQEALYQGYPIFLPSVQMLQPLLPVVWTVSGALLATYLVCEIRELLAGRAVPGRFLCCISGCIINCLAWLVAEEMAWGYLVVSLWHALQYLAYVQAFRSRPPKGSTPLKLSPLKHLGLLLLIGVGLTALFRGVAYFVPAIFAVVHLSLNFHHYLSDTLIWRRPKPPTPQV